MGYLAYLIAAIRMLFTDTKGLEPNAGAQLYLSFAEKLNYAFIWVCLAIWVIALLVVGIMALSRSYEFRLSSIGCGCQAIFLLFLPLMQWIIWRLNIGMLHNFSAEGPTDFKFWVYLLITVLLGSG